MDREEAIERLRRHAEELRRLGVRHLFLFGSTARGAARATSDVDLFVDYDEGRFDLCDLLGAQEVAARVLGRDVDLTTRDGLHALLRPRIEASALRVF